MEVQCEKCKSAALPSDCITCTNCQNRFHQQCAKVDNSTPHQNWECDDCTSSSSVPRVVQKIQQLQRELALERKAIDKRLDILQKHVDVLKAQIETIPPLIERSGSAVVCDVDKISDDEISNDDSGTISESGLQKMFARQVIPSDLPTFSGNPEDWPIFISSYKNSTKACGFTDVENLIRLQRCLRGSARQAVHSKLLLPNCVNQVIDTLELLYGRPELLISSLISQIHETPAPRDDDLNSLIVYGLAVQNLSDHMIAAGLRSHLNNPCLLQEMVNKLPTHLKLKWAVHKGGYNDITIATFSGFMSELVTAASQVTSTITMMSPNNHQEEQRDDSSGEVESNQSLPISRREKRKRCYVCGECNHRVANCAKISSMHVRERWDLINELKICPCCLNRHLPWPCRTIKNCDINGCQMKHHPLLHSTNGTLSTSGCTVDIGASERTLMKYVPVKLHGKTKSIETIAFIDEGSSCTMLESGLAEELEIDGDADTLSLRWIDGSVKTVMTRSATVGISDVCAGSNNQLELKEVHTVSHLDLPVQQVNVSLLSHDHLRDLPLIPYDHAKPRLWLTCRKV